MIVKNVPIIVFILLSLTVPLTVCDASGTIVYVDTDGSGNYNCDGTNDHIEINKALAYVNRLGGGTVYLRGPNTYWISSTLYIGSNTILTGDSSAEIKLVPNARWSSGVPLITNIGNDNITITGFIIDGNSEKQAVSLGQGYYNLIYFENTKDVTVSHMRLEWGCGDGLKIRNSNNIKFIYNDVYKLGHDAFYALGCTNGEVAYNTVMTRTNSACRLSGGASNFVVHDNLFYSSISGDSTGPAIEIDKTTLSSTSSFNNIEIYNNKIHTMNGAGIWMFAGYPDNVIRARNVYIHHNIFTNVGQYIVNTGYSNAAIVIQNFDDTIIEHNVFDNGGHAAIKWYVWSGHIPQQKAQFTTYVRNNIIMNNDGVSTVKGSGVGIWNTQPSYATFIVENNAFYNNKNGQTYGSGFIMNDNLDADPLCADATNSNVNLRDYHLKSKAGRYLDGKWVIDSVSSPLIDAGYSKSEFSNEPSPNGGIVNIGRYGNTVQASKSGSSALPVSNNNDNSPTVYDNRLRESSPNTVQSDSTFIDIGGITSSYRDLMWFDLSSYNSTDTISKATLNLYWYYPAGTARSSDTVVEVYRPASEWDPRSVTWNQRASGVAWSTPGGNWYDKNGIAQGNTPYASVTFPAATVPSNKYYEFDVTQLVQEYVSGKYANTGFFLKARTEGGNYIAFYSSEWSNADQRPKLSVNAVPMTPDEPPVADAGSDLSVTVGSTVTFDGSASTDDKGIVSYSWDFDISDGISVDATGKTVTKVYDRPGTYTVTLTVTDTSGQTATDTLTVVVSIAPVSNIISDHTVYDNRLRESSPNTVLSDSTFIDIGGITSSYRDLMWFDLSSYNSTDTISKATLNLYWYYPAGTARSSDTVVEVYRPASEWDPRSVTWNQRASGVAWSTPGGNWYDKNGIAQGNTPYASVTFPAATVPSNKYYEFDVTQLVQEYVSGKYANTGFFLKARTEGGNYIAFYSSEWSNADQRPKLSVNAVPMTPDEPPVADAGSDLSVTVGSTVTFDGSASTDDKGIVSYSWDFDISDGISVDATGKTVTKVYDRPGTYTVTLTVTDTVGQTATDTLTVVVSIAPVSNIISDHTVYDNRLRESSPNTVLSDSTFIDIGGITSSYRDLMWFDLSSYNSTDTISKATLNLYWYYPAGTARSSDTVVEVYRPASEWDPRSVTWNQRASGVAWSTPGGNWYDKNGIAQGNTPYASVTFPAATVPSNKYYEFDVTQLVQEYVSGKYANTGFFLKARTEGGNYIAFYSSEWSNADQRPKLSVNAVPMTPDEPPVADAGSDLSVTVGSTVTFDGSASTDDKGIVSYSWDFDISDGISVDATGKTVTKVYDRPGTYTVTLTVTDTVGQTATDTLTVVVSIAPVSNIISDHTVYDNRLRESSPNTVLSDSTFIDIGGITSSYRDLMWFDLSSYNSTDTISKATLNLYWYYPAGTARSSDTVVEVYRPASEWDPRSVTWNQRASGVAWSTPGGNWYDKNGIAQGNTPYASVTFPAATVPSNKYYEFDVTQLVQEYVSGKYANTGFFLKARTEGGNYIAFYSSEWSNADQRPKLSVNAVPMTPDEPPVADAGSDLSVTVGSTVTFDGSASTDDKGIVSYSWDFDISDGISVDATGKTVTKVYDRPGTYTVTLTVTDTSGQTATDTLTVVVSIAPVSNIISDHTVYDNRLRESSPNTVLSDSTFIDIGGITSSYRDLMWFDLSSYNSTDTISKATLNLYWYYPAGTARSSDTVVEVYRPASEWDPRSVTWNQRASGVAWSTPGGNWYDKNGIAQGNTPYASVTFPAATVPSNKYYEFDVTQLVQEYVSGKYANTGFFLKARTEGGNYIAFYSSEWSNADQRPKLSVTSY